MNVLKVLLFFVVSITIAACGSEAKFHSVYTYEKVENQNEKHDRRIYVCDYEKVKGSYDYVCREVSKSSCTLE